MNAQKIKIAQIITRMDWGGSPDVVRLLCTRLDPARFDCTLFTGPTRHPSARTRGFFTEHVGKIVCVDSLQRSINPVRDVRAYYRLRTLIRQGGYDIVHTHTAKAGLLGRWAAHHTTQAKIIHTSHGHNLYGYFNPMMTRMILTCERRTATITDVLVALTHLEKSDLRRVGIGNQQQIEVIAQGIESRHDPITDRQGQELRRALGLPEGGPVVAMIGRLETIKGPAYFINAAIALARTHEQVRFLVVGDGSLRGSLEQLVTRHGLSERIICTGWRDDIAGVLRISDMVVLPSLNEAVGMVLIEAQAAGIPVIASRVGGIPEVVDDGATGILVDPRDSEQLSQAINKLLHDAEVRRIMGEKARLWVQNRFTADRMVSQYARLYERVMQE